jgi:hypothetical protein
VGVDAHGKAVSQAGLGCGQKEGGHGRVGQCGGVRARGTVKAMAAAGCEGGALGSCTKTARWPEGKKGVLWPGYGGLIGIAGSRGNKKGLQQWCSPAGLIGERPGAVAGRSWWVEAVQGEQLRPCRCTGAGAVMLR